MHEKAVVIMYPDSRTTGGGLIGDRIREVSLLVGDFHRTVSEIIKGYRAMNFPIFGVTYNDTTRATFSPLYPYQLFDQLVPVGVTYNAWPSHHHRPKHEKLLTELLPQFNLQPESIAVVGGYHFGDCVQTMANVLNNNGHYAKVNPLLTDKLGEIVVARRISRLKPTNKN